MRSRWNFPIYIVYLAISLGVIGFIVAQLGITVPWSHPYTLTAMFSDGADILTNNEVYMNGTKVGHVADVTVINGIAHVRMVIDNPNGLPIHSDATAEVRKKNLLGETYVDLQRGSAPINMNSGGIIAVDHTIPITEIDQVLAIFDPQTVQRVQLLINALGDATTNNGPTMNSEASTANQLLTVLNQPAVELSVRKQQVQDIVLELQKFYTVLANQRGQIRDGFTTWNQVMGQLANQEAAISTTFQQADLLLQNVDTLVSGRGSTINRILGQLAGTVTSQGSIGGNGALASLNAFLDQSNTIIAGIAPMRRYVGDVFPDLNTSFADKDASGQHFWSVFSVGCQPNACSNGAPASYNGSGGSSDIWSVLTTGGGAQ